MEMLENADESMENIYILDIQILHQFLELIDIDQFFDSTHHFPDNGPSFRKSPVQATVSSAVKEQKEHFHILYIKW